MKKKFKKYLLFLITLKNLETLNNAASSQELADTSNMLCEDDLWLHRMMEFLNIKKNYSV